MPSHPIIGLAGGIGSGKSTVANILEELGCVVSRSDREGRSALEDPEIRQQLVDWWGPDILDDDGEIDRSAVAAIVFHDRDQLRRLESLTHPWIERRRRALFAAAPADAVALVIDAPLLFEAGLDGGCDAIIFVATDRAVRLERVQRTRGWDDAELTRREDSQMPLDAKRLGADYVIENDGDSQELFERVRHVLHQIANSGLNETKDRSSPMSPMARRRGLGKPKPPEREAQ